MFLCSWRQTWCYFTCQQSHVYVLRNVFMAATSADGWNGSCHFAFQTSNGPPLIWCFHTSGLKKCCFFQWVTPVPTQLGIRVGYWQLQKCQQNLEMRWWSSQAFNITKRKERGTTCQLLPVLLAQGASAFPLPSFMQHEPAQGERWVTDHLQSNSAGPRQGTAAHSQCSHTKTTVLAF